MSVYQKVPSFI